MRFFNVYGLRSRTTGTYGAVLNFLAQKLATSIYYCYDVNQGRDLFLFLT